MTAKTDSYQAGLNVTATNNFTITTDGAGALKVSRGNPGATTQDCIVIDANGDTALQLGGWTSWAATVVPSAGAFSNMTSTQFFKRLGKMVWFQIRINLVANGTGSGNIGFSLPTGATPARDFVCAGREDAVGGKLLQAQIKTGVATAPIFNYDNTYPGVNGAILTMSGFYETT